VTWDQGAEMAQGAGSPWSFQRARRAGRHRCGAGTLCWPHGALAMRASNRRRMWSGGADGDDALTARARRAVPGLLGLFRGRPTRERVDDHAGAPGLDRAVGGEQLRALAVQMLCVADGRVLVGSAMGDRDIVSGLSEQADRNRAEKPRPTNKGNAHQRSSWQHSDGPPLE